MSQKKWQHKSEKLSKSLETTQSRCQSGWRRAGERETTTNNPVKITQLNHCLISSFILGLFSLLSCAKHHEKLTHCQQFCWLLPTHKYTCEITPWFNHCGLPSQQVLWERCGGWKQNREKSLNELTRNWQLGNKKVWLFGTCVSGWGWVRKLLLFFLQSINKERTLNFVRIPNVC